MEFALGERWQGSFGALLRSAHALVTTSVAEGFGLAFLEPWLAERAVVGRDLPEITHEFQAEGVDPGGLYTRLEVPVDWAGWEVLERKVREGLEDYSLPRYGSARLRSTARSWNPPRDPWKRSRARRC